VAAARDETPGEWMRREERSLLRKPTQPARRSRPTSTFSHGLVRRRARTASAAGDGGVAITQEALGGVREGEEKLPLKQRSPGPPSRRARSGGGAASRLAYGGNQRVALVAGRCSVNRGRKDGQKYLRRCLLGQAR
jgi:hypothetical protein